MSILTQPSFIRSNWWLKLTGPLLLAALGVGLFFHALAPATATPLTPAHVSALGLTAWPTTETRAGLNAPQAATVTTSVSLPTSGLVPPLSISSQSLTTDPVWQAPDGAVSGALAWGDYDSDGDLDLASGNIWYKPNTVYENVNGILRAKWQSSDADWTDSIAWGDYDSDGDLDLAAGNWGAPNKVYENVAGNLQFDPANGIGWQANITYSTASVAWGDYDGDSDLDLAVGNTEGGFNYVYENISGILQLDPLNGLGWKAPYTDSTQSVAWGDYDGDGDLDLAVGNRSDIPNGYMAHNKVYENISGTLQLDTLNDVGWEATDSKLTNSVAWGDYDNDGDLDLTVGNGDPYEAQPNQVYKNNSGTLQLDTWNPGGGHTFSIAWADCDGDGDLDLVTGNSTQSPSRIFENTGNGNLSATAGWSASANYDTTSVALGDYDGDGDLDLAVGNGGTNTKIYANLTSSLSNSPSWQSSGTNDTYSLAWGDYDGDGDLDLATGNYGGPSKIYENISGTVQATPSWQSVYSDSTQSVAWGDYDGDGDLDLATGNGYFGDPRSLKIYGNTGGTFSLAWQSAISDTTFSIAWGDYDGDGDLDLAAGNDGTTSKVYENNNGSLHFDPSNPDPNLRWGWQSPIVLGPVREVAWGDYDGDGDLDLVIGSHYGSATIRIYENTGSDLQLDPANGLGWQVSDGIAVASLAWGDYDRDGDLDLAVGAVKQAKKVYENVGGKLLCDPDSGLGWQSSDFADNTQSIAWGDYDGDGDLDLTTGNMGGGIKIYENIGGPLKFGLDPAKRMGWQSSFSGSISSLAWGDYDGDGTPDLAIGYTYVSGGPASRIAKNFRNPQAPRVAPQLTGSPALTFNGGQTSALAPANGYALSWVRPERFIPISYTLAYSNSATLSVRGFYSLDGGGRWLPAVASTTTLTTGVSPTGSHVFLWDTFQSGFFGQSDNVVFRLQAIPETQLAPATVAGPYQWGSGTTATFPFRVRGTQVQVISNSVPVSNAVVYRLSSGQLNGALPFADGAGQAYRTDVNGYLQGRGQLNVGDRLMALYPLSATSAYTIYATSALPTVSGLAMYTVTTGGVQTLSVSATKPLVLFDISVSLEWDARQDTSFLKQLEFDLGRTSEFLYDWTNGQVALGNITLYHNREHWNDAHVRIYGTNGLHPNADQGGVVRSSLVETATSNLGAVNTVTYRPGQVRMAAVWSRFGAGAVGEDWPRTLAHELGHYLLFQDDAYIGANAQGQFYPLAQCAGTAMTDPYREDYSEFKLPTEWSPTCDETLAARTTGRSEWATLLKFYPALTATANPGPAVLPLAVTQIRYSNPTTPTAALAVPVFYLTSGGGRYVARATAKAILYQPDQRRLLDLGHPVDDRVQAYGARPGDRLCVYDADARKLGCETVTAGDTQLNLTDLAANWQPDIIVTPVNSRTIELYVGNAPPSVTLQAQIYPNDGAASAVITPTERSPGVYTSTVALDAPTLAAHVVVWVAEPEPRREALSAYAVGGNPVGKPKPPPNRAPVNSNDGEVTLYTLANFPTGEFYALQRATYVPPIPAWLTLVGPGYRIVKSAGAPSLSQSAISFNYDQSAAPPGEENFLQVYYYQNGAWTPLTTTLDTGRNAALAPTQDAGLYALLASFQVSLPAVGWNLFAYPVQATRSVTEALLSISGNYTTVYGYVVTDTVNPWRIYDVQAASKGYVNDLTMLEFGKGYWINVSAAAVLKLTGGTGQTPALPTNAPSFSMPPMTVYGTLQASANFTPTAGMTVTAWVNGVACGQTVTRAYAGQVVYVLKVLADGAGNEGCGATGRTITLKTSGATLGSPAWGMGTVTETALAKQPEKLYFPLIRR